MTLAEAYDAVARFVRDMRLRGWRIKGDVTIEPMILPPEQEVLPTAPPPVEVTGMTCVKCGGQTKRAGACEVCTNCGETTGCG